MKVASNNTIGDSSPSVLPIVEQLRVVIRQEIEAAMGHGGDRLTSPQALPKPYLTIKEAAEMARLAPSTIRLFIRKRELKALQVGGRVIIKRADLEKFLESRPIDFFPD